MRMQYLALSNRQLAYDRPTEKQYTSFLYRFLDWNDLAVAIATKFIANPPICESVSTISLLHIGEFARRASGDCRSLEVSHRRHLPDAIRQRFGLDTSLPIAYSDECRHKIVRPCRLGGNNAARLG